MKRIITLMALSLCCFMSCQSYRFGEGGVLQDYSTVSVPYVKNDVEGQLTDALIKQISASGSLRYVSEEGDLVLEAEIVDFKDENIGFRYDKDDQGELLDKVVPSENRMTAIVLVTVKDRSSGKKVLGPITLASGVDYDYDFNPIKDTEMTYSMGQLNFIDNAKDAAYTPLYKGLAQRIVEYMNNSW